MKTVPFDIIVIGELNVDIILNNISGFPEIGKEILADRMSVTLGSSSAIFANNMSALGNRVAFIGKTGRDSFADVVLSTLSKSKVDTSHILKSDDLATGATIVLNYDQDRANVTYPGAMNDLKLQDIDFDFLPTAKHVHFSNYFMQPGIRHDLPELFRRAKKIGLTTSFDPQCDPEEKWEFPYDEMLPHIDLFLPNANEIMSMTGCSSVIEAIEKLKGSAGIIVVKNGCEGAIAWDGREILRQPAFKNDQIVDCIGAGDSFNAGFISEFIKGAPLKRCLEIGALAGAINTTGAGGTSAFGSLDMIRKTAKNKFSYTL
ncbi:MAG TPA: carbohydrate kinase family protein [Bacteroidales bacterium]|jgi:sugar/nucleoside kinase (ribokinase family)|nr:carbohydrate kinase family protein [Bacteroidales bacterium]